MKITYSNDTLTPEDVVKFLSLTGQSHSIYKPIIIHKEVVKKAGELGITVSDEQLQHFADHFRTLKGFIFRSGDVRFSKKLRSDRG